MSEDIDVLELGGIASKDFQFKFERRLAEVDLGDFLQKAWPHFDPAPFQYNWHMSLIGEYLELVDRHEIQNLIINIPPGYSKSSIVTIAWPCQSWTRNPTTQWFFSSYSGFLSERHSEGRRQILQSPWFRKNWGHRFNFTGKINQRGAYQNSKGGYMFATSVDAKGTGLGGNRIVIDDPLSANQALSKAMRNHAIEYVRGTVTARLRDKKTGSFVVVMQRLNPTDVTSDLMGFETDDDIVGNVQTKGNWTLLRLPAEAEEYEEIKFPISGKVHIREKGEALWHDREPLSILEKMKEEMRWHYAAQYGQRPTIRGGNIFKETWFKYYAEDPKVLVKRLPHVILSVDAAFKKKEDSSYVAIAVMGRHKLDTYMIDLARGHWSLMETIEQIRLFAAAYPQAITKLIEEKANGIAIIEMLKDTFGGIVPFEPGNDSKESRAFAVSPLVFNGHLWLPKRRTKWLTAYKLEMIRFPEGDDTDQVDATTQGLIHFETLYGGRQRRSKKLARGLVRHG